MTICEGGKVVKKLNEHEVKLLKALISERKSFFEVDGKNMLLRFLNYEERR